MSEIKCPQCATDNVQRVEVAYLQGSSNIDAVSKTMGVGVGRGGGSWNAGVGGARTSTTGTTQSLLAGQIAPPSKKSFKYAFLLVIAGIVIFLMVDFISEIAFIITPVLFLIAGIVAWDVHKYNSECIPALLAVWKKEWLCQKCGDVFVPEAG